MDIAFGGVASSDPNKIRMNVSLILGVKRFVSNIDLE